jgi:co-chaperonin GroES (HSP10)
MRGKAKALAVNPLPGIVYIKSDEVSSGMLDTSSRQSAVEVAVVVAMGTGVEGLLVGDRIFYKAWACDTITHEGVRYNFINVATGGILAVVR